jgi:hypothetical protein
VESGSSACGAEGSRSDGKRPKLGSRATEAWGSKLRQIETLAVEASSRRVGMMAVAGCVVARAWAKLPVHE